MRAKKERTSGRRGVLAMPKPKQFKCWLCGKDRPLGGKCPYCKAPPRKPDGWIGSTYKDREDPLFHSAEGSKATASGSSTIEPKSSKRTYVKKVRGERRPKKDYSSIFLRKKTKEKLQILRRELPYSASCKSMDSLINALYSKAKPKEV